MNENEMLISKQGCDKSALKNIDEIVDILDRSFPNFHRTKNINVEVGRALSHLGYQPYKTASCQKYFIEEST